MWSRVLRVAMLTALWGLGDLQGTTTVKPGRGKGSNWWGIAKAGEPNNLIPMSPGMVYMDSSVLTNLRKKQKRLVRENVGILMAVSKGATMAVQECQSQFRNRRWNCSTRNFFRGKNLFGKIVDKGCRETAFIYAITAAAVTHSVARGCAEGSIQSCTCDFTHQGKGGSGVPTNAVTGKRDWEWGGCSDNIGFGYKFSREFVDAGERGRNAREQMNLHNNEAGRAIVHRNMRQECKCHGMSGSCTTRTCWMRLASFRAIGDDLKEKFDRASRIMVANSESGENGHGLSRKKRNRYKMRLLPHNPDHKPPTKFDLVYTEPSPSFCEKNARLGIQGTQGRQCNESSIGLDSCDLMCCNRGYRTHETMAVERCGCTFQWCCEVKCNICRVTKKIHTCL